MESQKTTEDFSLVLGGPLFRIFQHLYLSGNALELLQRRVIVITAISWLPLLILSVWKGRAWGTNVTLPFFHDIDAHVRFLISLPLLILAESIVHRRMRNVVRQFLERGLIPDRARHELDNAVASANRLRNSVLAELLLIVLVYGLAVFLMGQRYVALGVASWYGTPLDGLMDRSLAGWWFSVVSQPFFYFLLFRWYFRLFIWAQFLFRLSRIPLNLFPTHPDGSAGLGFLSGISRAFMPLMLAQGTVLAGTIADRIFFAGAQLTHFKTEIAGIVGFVVLIVLAPLLVFCPQLERVKRTGRREYGLLAQRYVREFDSKWVRGGAAAHEQLIGSSDIQSLADLGNSYEVVKDMKWVPFSAKTVLQLAVITLVPVLPLTLTMIPVDQLLDRLLRVII